MLTQLFLINEQSTQADLIVMEYKTNGLPKINAFVEDLRKFGRANPDFNPILAKYNLLSAPAAPAAVPKK